MKSLLDRARRRARDRVPANGARSPEAVDELVAGRGPLEAIDVLTSANRERRDAEVERRLVRVRHEAFNHLDRSPPAAPAPEQVDEVPDAAISGWGMSDGLPEVTPDALTPELVRAAFLRHGSLLVRGLVARDRAERLKDGLDRTFAARDDHIRGEPVSRTTPWFDPFEPAAEFRFDGHQWNRLKRGGGSVWAPDSPRMLYELLDAFEDAGVQQLVASYLGERPVLSMHKSVLRRVSPDTGSAWHQDGAFLGEGIRTLNVWLALSACGVDAPGLDVVPERLDLVPTGTEGALFDWSVSPALVDELIGGRRPARPVFEPGDALLFDHLCLHQTATDPTMIANRYATETWCFAPSAYPGRQVPLVL